MVDDLEKGVGCGQMVCTTLNSVPASDSYKEHLTGDCINTGHEDIVPIIINWIRENQGRWSNLTEREYTTHRDELTRRVGHGQKVRPIQPPGKHYISAVIKSMEEGILKYTKHMRDHYKIMHMDSTLWGNVPNDAWVQNIIGKLKIDVKELYYSHVKSATGSSLNINESIINDMLNQLQQHVTLVKHDKVSGATQLLCHRATHRLTALSMTRQDRFVEKGSVHVAQQEIQQRMERLVYSTHIRGWLKNGKEVVLPLVKELMDLYGYQYEAALRNITPNELSLTYKSHKDMQNRLFRLITGCVNRSDHPNLFRMLHDIVTKMFESIQNTYKDMALNLPDLYSYNIVDSPMDLAKKLRTCNSKAGILQTQDIKTCYPSHRVKAHLLKEGLENPVQLCGRSSNCKNVQLTITQLLSGQGVQWSEKELYVEEFSSLDIIKRFLHNVFQYYDDILPEEGEVFLVGEKRGRSVLWSFKKGSTVKQSKKKSIALSLNALIWLIAESLRDQFVAFGGVILEIIRGILEGQSSSTRLQNCHHQQLLNMEVHRLKSIGKLAEALLLMRTTSLFVDDLLSLEGCFNRDISHGQFVLERESSNYKIIFLGFLLFICTKCHKRLGTQPSTRKHGEGRIFPPGMLDHWDLDNSPKNSKLGMITNSITRVYRCSSAMKPVIVAVEELVTMASMQGYPSQKVDSAIAATLASLLRKDPKPQNADVEVQQQYSSLLTGKVASALRRKFHLKKRKRKRSDIGEDRDLFCEHCAMLP